MWLLLLVGITSLDVADSNYGHEVLFRIFFPITSLDYRSGALNYVIIYPGYGNCSVKESCRRNKLHISSQYDALNHNNFVFRPLA
jgi:hypothetical protein